MQNYSMNPASWLRSAVQLAPIAALVIAPLAASLLPAQSGKSVVTVRDVGKGAKTWVLLSGTLGGVSGMHRLETRLVASGVRVVTVDVYGLSVDSADVSFAALARRVDATLERLGVKQAHVVGHAHGGGVGLRLAAMYPERVSALDLLDVGALSSNRTSAMGGAVRLAPMLSRMPGGQAFIRTRLVNGIRENSGETEWFDIETERAYTQPVLDNVSRAVAMAERLARATEPDSIAWLVTRLHVPVTVILGQSPHATSPSAQHMAALAPLGSRLRVVRLRGVGHFPHEEAPDQVVRALTVTIAVVAKEIEQ